MTELKNFSTSELGLTISAEVTIIGKDLLIKISGGDTPHIGTVTTLSKTAAIETRCFPSHDGRLHKDDVLALIVAKKIQPLLPGTCVITAGVHVNKITSDQIVAASKITQQLAEEIANWITKFDFTTPEPIYYQ
ncbi:amino acid decarboxylase [Enterococcus sp. HY326]|uniref:prenylated flavin chaperone LpdD n=1 Tax=Enterococcus sp. HY326 TaxID=2971265 RepID=UPI00223F6A3C|nr:amino acid decarboxylase [Enterococcus sp. HY326]